jgi:hypothetical protein
MNFIKLYYFIYDISTGIISLARVKDMLSLQRPPPTYPIRRQEKI